jgi:hypothetical protein
MIVAVVLSVAIGAAALSALVIGALRLWNVL